MEIKKVGKVYFFDKHELECRFYEGPHEYWLG